jgi:D-alanine-D-alanine ligase
MKYKIAIIAGGDSGEYEISLKSADIVVKHLDRSKFECFLIIMKGKEWSYTDKSGKVYFVDRNDFTLDIQGEKLVFDGVFIAIHGTPGEDGKIQGYFDLLNIPYTSCDQATSAITFNKYFCNHFVSNFGIYVAKSLLVTKNDKFDPDELKSQVSLPLFAKPNRGGSSVGTSKIKTWQELDPALLKAYKEDDQVLLEEYIPGRELSCGAFFRKGRVITLPITEIISEKEFFDYEAKYEGKSDEITPADIPDDVANAVTDTSLMLYKLLACRGIVRFDYILKEDKLYFLEVNTVPGMSELSIVPQQALKAGISLQELFTETMTNALNGWKA